MPRKLALAAEILALYVGARWRLRGNDIRAALAGMRDARHRADPDGDPAAHAAGLRYARAVTRVLGALPSDSRCLMQSVVLDALLARRGLRSAVVIGVRPGSNFAAHAWVELDGHPLLPPQRDEFERLLAL
jgi:hypothetical protein